MFKTPITFLTIFVLLKALGLQSARLEQCQKSADDLFTGVESFHTIDSVIEPFDVFRDKYKALSIKEVKPEMQGLTTLLKDCVFHKTAVHDYLYLSDEEQSQIADTMAHYLLVLPGLSYYRINSSDVPGGNITTASCAMGIRDAHRILIMQGGLSD